MNKLYYTYDNLRQDVLRVIKQMNEKQWEPELILGVAMGGLIPANYFSQWLNLPLYSYHYSLRDHQRVDTFDPTLVAAVKNKKVLIVDDICDEGHTLNKISEMIENHDCSPRFATLHHNMGQEIFEPHFSGTEINKTETPVWIVYPWEEWWSY